MFSKLVGNVVLQFEEEEDASVQTHDKSSRRIEKRCGRKQQRKRKGSFVAMLEETAAEEKEGSFVSLRAFMGRPSHEGIPFPIDSEILPCVLKYM